jgi:hypothetical protein
MTVSSLLESVCKFIVILSLYGKWGDTCILWMKRPFFQIDVVPGDENRKDGRAPIIESLPGQIAAPDKAGLAMTEKNQWQALPSLLCINTVLIPFTGTPPAFDIPKRHCPGLRAS